LALRAQAPPDKTMTSSDTRTRKDLETLIAAFNATREALVSAIESVPAELRDMSFVGDWDVRDVVAHTVGWDYTNVEALPDFASGRLPAFFDRYDPDWAAVNADLVARYRLDDWDALMGSLREAQRAFVEALSAFSDDALDNAVSWRGRRVSLRGMLRAISRDEAEHVRQIKAFLSRRSQ
jgi:hypothetical protein